MSTSMFQVFHLFQNVYCKCFYLNVASVCSECFICFRRMLQLFHLSVVKVDRRCGGSLSPQWSSYCGSLVWRRWRPRTRERRRRDVTADQVGWAWARRIGQDGEQDGRGQGSCIGRGHGSSVWTLERDGRGRWGLRRVREKELRPNERRIWTSERYCLHSRRRLVAGTVGSLFHKV